MGARRKSADGSTEATWCPQCRTAELTYGRTICQACAVSEHIRNRVVTPVMATKDAAQASRRMTALDAALDPQLEAVREPATCCKCGTYPAGPGGVLCPGCKDMILAGGIREQEAGAA